MLYLFALFVISPFTYSDSCEAPPSNLRDLTAAVYSKASVFCEELKVGDKKPVNFNTEQSPSGMPHKYILSRPKKNEFKVSLNLRFFPSKNHYDGAYSNELSQAYRSSKKRVKKEMLAEIKGNIDYVYRERAKYCLSKLSPNLIGPKGERITIELLDDPTDKENEILHKVFIRDVEHRSSSRSYESDIDCSTILHEVFHLMGLPDEYFEADRFEEDRSQSPQVEDDIVYRYNCRFIYKQRSIMKYQDNMVQAVREGVHKYRFQFCYCTESKQVCSESLTENMSGKSYALGKKCANNYKTNGNVFESDQGNLPSPEKGIGLGAGGDIIFTGVGMNNNFGAYLLIEDLGKVPGPQSLINTEQFNAIVFPGCMQKNHALYYKARNAYLTDKDLGGPESTCMSLKQFYQSTYGKYSELEWRSGK